MSAEAFCAQLTALFSQIAAADPLKVVREKAYDHFLEVGLPDRKREAFQYVSLQKLYEEKIALTTTHTLTKQQIESYPESKDSCLVFVNGCFEPELSSLKTIPKQVVILPLLDAMRSYGNFLQNRWSKALREETDPFAILNLAMHQRGVFVYVPPKVVVENPIQCLSITTTAESFALPRIQLFVASHASVEWISSSRGDGFSNALLDLTLEDSARFRYTGMEKMRYHLGSLRATLKRDASLSTFSTGGLRTSYRVALCGENSEANLQGLWMLQGKEQTHTHVVVDHEAPHCRSMQKFKGILDDLSQSSFEGKIVVRQAAQKTEAYQLNNNLLLHDHAIANSKPNLEIFADDVKASHGATFAQIDPEHLFYLQSRGISEPQAKRLLIQGYAQEVIDTIPYPSIHNQMVTHVQQLLTSPL